MEVKRDNNKQIDEFSKSIFCNLTTKRCELKSFLKRIRSTPSDNSHIQHIFQSLSRISYSNSSQPFYK